MWGWHNYIGPGTYNYINYPYKMTVLAATAQVGAGGDQTMAIDVTDQVSDWGGNTAGKLGDGDQVETHGPKVIVPPPVDPTTVDPTAPPAPAPAPVVTDPVVPDPVVTDPVVAPTVVAPTQPVVAPVVVTTPTRTVAPVVPTVVAKPSLIPPFVGALMVVNEPVHDDNGHGNDPGKYDPSNPGVSKDGVKGPAVASTASEITITVTTDNKGTKCTVLSNIR